MEEVMKTLLGTAVVLAGLTFGVSNSFANPAIGCGCTLVLRNGTTAIFNFGTRSALEHEDITVAESGNIDANCKADLGTGSQQTFDFGNTGFTCSITGSAGPTDIPPTTDWKEVISANGQTTLQCHFH
jgi:hypothetical protein